jgi:hypothetical protein
MPPFDTDDALAALLADFLAVDARAIKKAGGQTVPVDAATKVQEELPPSLREMIAEQCAADPDRLPWPDDWFDHTDSGQAQACRDLWGAALIACIRTALDATGVYDGRPSRETVNLSSSWFRSSDFHMMCALAGLDGVACMNRLIDPDRVPEIIAAFKGAPKGGAAFHATSERGADADGHL